jgi:hypothetical protein
VEARVEQALRALEPGKLQRLAEAWAVLTWPGRYDHLVPQGRTAFDATRAGWPDAWAVDGEGTHLLEITGAQRWEQHLDEDVGKTERLDTAPASFVFVTRAPEPGAALLRPYRDRLVAAGVPAGSIDFVFRERLRRSLSTPRFAKVRTELLGLSATAAPFTPIDQAAGLFGTDGSEVFQPSRAEILDGRVHRGQASRQLEARLAESRFALLRGRGAAGKTVLVADFALRWTTLLRPAYYLDAAPFDVTQRRADVERAIADWGGPGVLFIIDNAHLHATAAEEAVHAWREMDDGSLLVLATRIGVRGAPGAPPPFTALIDDEVVLVPGPSDVLGVYRRLAQRSMDVVPEPPAFAVRAWTDLFAGDLIALSAALVDRLSTPWTDWRLTAGHAQEHVRSEYLEAIAPDDREHLLRLALCSWAELPCTPAAADPFALRVLEQRGIVLRDRDGRLSLPHPGIGELILTAAGSPPPAAELAAGAAERDPALGFSLAMLLYERHRDASARAAHAAFRARGGARILIDTHLRHLPRIVELVAKDGASHQEIDAELSTVPSAWTSALHALPAGSFATVSSYARAELPRTFAVIDRVFTSDVAKFAWPAEGAHRLHGLGALLNAVEGSWPEHLEATDRAIADGPLLPTIAADLADRSLSRQHSQALSRIARLAPRTAAVLDERLDSTPERWECLIADSRPTAVARALEVPDPPFTRLRRLLLGAIDEGHAARWLERYFWRLPGDRTNALREFQAAFPGHAEHLRAALLAPRHVDRWVDHVRRRGLGVLDQLIAPHADTTIEPLLMEVVDRLFASDAALEPRWAAERTSVAQLGVLLRGLARRPGLEPLLEVLRDPEVLEPARRQVLEQSPAELVGAFRRAGTGLAEILDGIDEAAWATSALVQDPRAVARHFWPLMSIATTARSTVLPTELAVAIAHALASRQIPTNAVGLDVALAVFTRWLPDSDPRRDAAIAVLEHDPDWPGSGFRRVGAGARGTAVLQAQLKLPALLRGWLPEEISIAEPGRPEAIDDLQLYGALRLTRTPSLRERVAPHRPIREPQAVDLVHQVQRVPPAAQLSYGLLALALAAFGLSETWPAATPSPRWARRVVELEDPRGLLTAELPTMREVSAWLTHLARQPG